MPVEIQPEGNLIALHIAVHFIGIALVIVERSNTPVIIAIALLIKKVLTNTGDMVYIQGTSPAIAVEFPPTNEAKFFPGLRGPDGFYIKGIYSSIDFLITLYVFDFPFCLCIRKYIPVGPSRRN